MWRIYLIAIALLAIPAAAQVSNTASPAPSEFLCTADSLSIAPTHDHLIEGTHSVTLMWGFPGFTPDWYRVYRSTTNGGPYTLIADCVQSLSYTDASVADGQTYFYVVTDLTAGVESADSNQSTANIPVFDTIAVSYTGPKPNLSETLSSTDALTHIHSASRSPSETLSTGDSFARSPAHFRVAQETLTTSASLVSLSTGPNLLGPFEDLTTTDSLVRTSSEARAAVETLTTSDSAAGSLDNQYCQFVTTTGDLNPALQVTPASCSVSFPLTVEMLLQNNSRITPGSLSLNLSVGAVHGVCYYSTARDIILAQNLGATQQLLTLQNQADRLGRIAPGFINYPVNPGVSIAIQMRRQIGWVKGGQICFSATSGLNIAVIRYK